LVVRPDKTLCGTEEVNTDTLDSIATIERFNRIDFLKIDVEGAELRVLKGGRRAIQQFKPRIVMEIHPWGDGLRVESWLEQIGYLVE
jgi:FkbM family methyltransferase